MVLPRSQNAPLFYPHCLSLNWPEELPYWSLCFQKLRFPISSQPGIFLKVRLGHFPPWKSSVVPHHLLREISVPAQAPQELTFQSSSDSVLGSVCSCPTRPPVYSQVYLEPVCLRACSLMSSFPCYLNPIHSSKLKWHHLEKPSPFLPVETHGCFFSNLSALL